MRTVMATTMLKIGAPPRRPKNSSGSLCAVTVVSTAVRLALRARRTVSQGMQRATQQAGASGLITDESLASPS